jgi:hypothetical protein
MLGYSDGYEVGSGGGAASLSGGLDEESRVAQFLKIFNGLVRDC